MSDPHRDPDQREQPTNDSDDTSLQGQGPNLILIYSLIALAMAAAIGIALMIVAPFHHRG